MLFNLTPEVLIVNLIVLGIGMTLHEFAHNYVGWKMGDPVPKMQGRLTLNPLVHIHWVGWLMFALIGFGMLGSAPISAQRMRNPRWGFLAAVAAGPFANLAIAIVAGLIIRILGIQTFLSLPTFLQLLLGQMVVLNVLLFVFNLLPLFPLDGWHIVQCLLPATWLNRMQIPIVIQEKLHPISEFLKRPAHKWTEWQQASYYIFIGLIIWSLATYYFPFGLPNPLSILVMQPTSAISSLLIG